MFKNFSTSDELKEPIVIGDILSAIEALKDYAAPNYSPADHFDVNCSVDDLKIFFEINGCGVVQEKPPLASAWHGIPVLQKNTIPKNEMRLIDSLGYVKCRIKID